MNNLSIHSANAKSFLDRLHKDTIGLDAFVTDFFGDHSIEWNTGGYPPYNIERVSESEYNLEVAVAGFSPDDLQVEVENGMLTVTGEKVQKENSVEREFLYRGISARQFKRQWKLGEHIEVSTAGIENGLLSIKLVRNVPEALKPRKISIAKIA